MSILLWEGVAWPEEAKDDSLEELAEGKGFLPRLSESVVEYTSDWMSFPKSILLDIGGKVVLKFEAMFDLLKYGGDAQKL